jgi:hypothetical protein
MNVTVTDSCPLAALSLCPADALPQRALDLSNQGLMGDCTGIAAADTGTNEAGFYPAWRSFSGDALIVGISDKPFATIDAARYSLVFGIRRLCAANVEKAAKATVTALGKNNDL